MVEMVNKVGASDLTVPLASWPCSPPPGSDSSDAKTGGMFFSGKPVIRRAMELADRILPDSPEKRLQIPLCTDPSEDEEEEEEDMEVSFFALWGHVPVRCVRGADLRA